METERSALRWLLLIVRRRKWLILGTVVLVTAAAVGGSLLQDARYQASSEVLLSRENVAAVLGDGNVNPADFDDPERFAETQAQLARGEGPVSQVLESVGADDRTIDEFLDSSTVAPRADADILLFTVTDGDPDQAMQLATAYAREFTQLRSQLDIAPLVRAQETLKSRLDALAATGRGDSGEFAALSENLEELRVLESLRTSSATLLDPAERAVQVQPRVVRNGVIGFVVGIVLALGLGSLREALDISVRTREEVGERLGMPLLARLPTPPGRLRPEHELVMLAEPTSSAAEPFRVLRTNLEFVSLERSSSTVMITSAVQAEGKSTTAANLAIALARSGRRVVLVDLDLRRPTLDRLFGASGRPGLTSVTLGHVELEDALLNVPLDNGRAPHQTEDGDIERLSLAGGRLEVLPTGPLPPDAGGFIGSAAMTDVLSALRRRADIVLIDTPPVLPVGDAMTLSTKVDGIVVVARLGVLTRPMLAEFRRLLDASPAAKLGFVLSQSEVEDGASPYGKDPYGRYGYTPKMPTPEVRAGAEPPSPSTAQLPPSAALPTTAGQTDSRLPNATEPEAARKRALAQHPQGTTLTAAIREAPGEPKRNGKRAGLGQRTLSRLGVGGGTRD